MCSGTAGSAVVRCMRRTIGGYSSRCSKSEAFFSWRVDVVAALLLLFFGCDE